ncbi:putative ribonuclease H-like domain-containing protein, partial [Tanacetum coccineum]
MCVVNTLSFVNATPIVKIGLNKGKQIWKPKGKLSDNSLNKTKRVWKVTGKLFANIGYQWRPTGKKFTLGKLNSGYQWRPTRKKFALGRLCPLTKLYVKCRTGHPLVSGLGLFKTYDGESFKAQELYEKVHRDRQFCDSDLEVAFRKHSCFVRDTNGPDLLKGSRSTNLYTISIDDMMKSSPICLLSKPSKGLPRLKFEKDHLCSACQVGKSKKYSHKPKSENTNMEVLHTLHMDLCGQMRVQSINGKKYILVIMDDYSRFTWVKFLRSKDETPDTYNADILKSADVPMGSSCRYCLLHLEPILNSYSSQKTPYELVHDKKPDLTFLRVFSALCYPTNDSEYLGKLQAKADIGIFVGYAPSRKGFRIFKKRTRRIMETIHVTFNELHQTMAPIHISFGPEPMSMTPGQFSSGLIPNQVHATNYVLPTDKDLELLFQPMFNEYFEVTRFDAPVPSATAVNAYAVLPVGSTIEDTPTTQATLHPSSEPPGISPGELGSAQSSSGDVSRAEPNQVTQPSNHLRKWSKDHPLDNIVGNPSRLVSTKKQLAFDALWCCFHTELSKVEPKNFKMAMTEDSWFEAMQNEIHEFDHLELWVLVPKPKGVMIIALKWIYK